MTTKNKNYTTYFKNPHRYIKSVILKWVVKSWSWSWPKVKKVNSIFKKLLQDSWSRWQFFKILISGAFWGPGSLFKVVVYFWSYWRRFKIKITHFLKIMVLFKIEVRVLFLKIRHSLFEIKVHFFAWVTFSWSWFCFFVLPFYWSSLFLSWIFIFSHDLTF